MPVEVVVPWRSGGCPHREAAWQWVKARYEWPIIEGVCPEGPWSKGAAIADAVERSTADVLVVADADVYTDGIHDAVAQVKAGRPWAVPHLKVHRLDQTATTAVLTGTPPEETSGRAQTPYPGFVGGGIVVVRRDVYESAPVDPRFTGWGQEDQAWAKTLTTLYKRPWRGSAPLWHLWHPPQQRMSRSVGSKETSALLARYRQARTVDAIRALIDEGRSVRVS